MNGPCLCGDPYCGRCFPRSPAEEDGDAAYEGYRQEQVDAETEEELP